MKRGIIVDIIVIHPTAFPRWRNSVHVSLVVTKAMFAGVTPCSPREKIEPSGSDQTTNCFAWGFSRDYLNLQTVHKLPPTAGNRSWLILILFNDSFTLTTSPQRWFRIVTLLVNVSSEYLLSPCIKMRQNISIFSFQRYSQLKQYGRKARVISSTWERAGRVFFF
jgi:hypothetical protein